MTAFDHATGSQRFSDVPRLPRRLTNEAPYRRPDLRVMPDVEFVRRPVPAGTTAGAAGATPVGALRRGRTSGSILIAFFVATLAFRLRRKP